MNETIDKLAAGFTPAEIAFERHQPVSTVESEIFVLQCLYEVDSIENLVDKYYQILYLKGMQVSRIIRAVTTLPKKPGQTGFWGFC